jgi:hypothetical protein
MSRPSVLIINTETREVESAFMDRVVTLTGLSLPHISHLFDNYKAFSHEHLVFMLYFKSQKSLTENQLAVLKSKLDATGRWPKPIPKTSKEIQDERRTKQETARARKIQEARGGKGAHRSDDEGIPVRGRLLENGEGK